MFAVLHNQGNVTAVPGDPEAHRAVLGQLNAKKQIIAELIQGRASLFQAAARFYSLAGSQAGNVDGETLCREVLGWADLALRDRPERAETITTHLEQELNTYITRYGSVDLPTA